MKKLYLILCCCMLAGIQISAQKLINGVKAPDLKISQWNSNQTPSSGKPTWIEFFVSRNKACIDRLDSLDVMAQKYPNELNIIIVTCETSQKIDSIRNAKNYPFLFGSDPQRKVFSAYGVQFVPFGVLLDPKDKVIWFGNPATFDNKTLLETLKNQK